MPTRNRADVLELNLQRLFELGVDQIVVVDDASDDNTPLLVKEFANRHTGLVYVRTVGREGSARARNIGLSKAAGDVILMMDDDRILRDANCVDAIKEDFQKDPSVGIIGGPSQATRKQSLDPDFFIKNAEFFTKVTGFVFLSNSYRSKTIVSFVSCPFAMRREIAGCIHYDENIRVTGYREESDYQLMARRKGWKILFDPRFVSYHYSHDRGGNRGQIMRERMCWKARNHALFIKKHNTGLKRVFYMLTGFGVLALHKPRYLRDISRIFIREWNLPN